VGEGDQNQARKQAKGAAKKDAEIAGMRRFAVSCSAIYWDMFNSVPLNKEV
jgi:hypothetical protein